LLLIGVNDHISKFISTVYTNPRYGYNIAGILTDVTILGELNKFKKGNLEDTFKFLDAHKSIDEMIISLPHSKADLINELLEYADNNMIRVSVIPEFSEYLSQLFSIEYVENIPVMKFRKEPLQSISNRMLKRGMDVVISSFVIVFIFSWLFPIIALVIKFGSKGPVFFAQERSGKYDKPFKCLKFRSMTVNGDSDTIQATKNDARITKIGAFLRKTSLDELPQVFNVLFNDMSIVGPRPHMLKHTEEYKRVVGKFMLRHAIKPGITGLAQAKGYRGEIKNMQLLEGRVKYDRFYVENWSLSLDIKIIFLTIQTLFKSHL